MAASKRFLYRLYCDDANYHVLSMRSLDVYEEVAKALRNMSYEEIVEPKEDWFAVLVGNFCRNTGSKQVEENNHHYVENMYDDELSRRLAAGKPEPDATAPAWHELRTDETRMIEDKLKAAGFPQTDAYRRNNTCIALRVINSRFTNVSMHVRHAMIDPMLDDLPTETQCDLALIVLLSPDELRDNGTAHNAGALALHRDFEEAEPSQLT